MSKGLPEYCGKGTLRQGFIRGPAPYLACSELRHSLTASGRCRDQPGSSQKCRDFPWSTFTGSCEQHEAKHGSMPASISKYGINTNHVCVYFSYILLSFLISFLAHRGVSALADKGTTSKELAHFPCGKGEAAHTPIAMPGGARPVAAKTKYDKM